MTLYGFPQFLVVDESMTPAKNAVGAVYAYTDTAYATPLATYDLGGIPVASLSANDTGVVQPFQVADQLLVRFKSGSYVVEMLSGKGIVDTAQAAVVAAELAQVAAEAAQAAAEAADAGVPSGGTAGQVLTKNSSTNGDASWAAPSGGSGTPDDASVTNAKVATGAAIVLSKTADDTAGAGRRALTNAQNTKLTDLPDNSSLTASLALKAPLANPTFTGTVTVPTNAFPTTAISALAEYIRDTVAAALRGVGIDVSAVGDDAADTITLTGGVSDDPSNGLSLGSDFKPFFSSTGLQPAGSYLTAPDIEWFLPLTVVTNFTDDPPAGFPDGGIVFSLNPSA